MLLPFAACLAASMFHPVPQPSPAYLSSTNANAVPLFVEYTDDADGEPMPVGSRWTGKSQQGGDEISYTVSARDGNEVTLSRPSLNDPGQINIVLQLGKKVVVKSVAYVGRGNRIDKLLSGNATLNGDKLKLILNVETRHGTRKGQWAHNVTLVREKQSR